MKKPKAKFMVLSHGRVGTCSLLDGFQYVPNLFVPSYWHTDSLLVSGDLNYIFDYSGRYSSQIKFPNEIPFINLGLINHNFPIDRAVFNQIANIAKNFLEKNSKIFIYDRDFKENILSSYKAYLTTWFCFHYSNGKLIPSISFNTPIPLHFNDFFARYDVIANISLQVETYKNLGYDIIKREFNFLDNLDFERRIQARSATLNN